ncbi:MAG: YlxR family protein [Clostridiales bacterium]|nr:YlxR family protein [Clostridiales bacterium]
MKHRIYDATGKFISVRMCVACRNCKEKSALLRVVKPKDGAVRIDGTGSMAGRGAYVCKNADCIARAQKIRGLERGVRAGVPKELYEELLKFEE